MILLKHEVQYYVEKWLEIVIWRIVRILLKQLDYSLSISMKWPTAGLKLWNKLPLNIEQSSPVAVFKTKTHYGIGVFCPTEQQIGWVPEKDQATLDAVGKACHLPNLHAKIDSVSAKNMGNKLPISIICEALWNKYMQISLSNFN